MYAPDAQGLQAWLNALQGGMDPGQIALGFAASGEREAQRITADYLKYLGRDPEPNIVPVWVNAFLHGTSNENVVAGFVGSAEYFQKHGNDIREFIFSAYRDILGRDPDAAGYNKLARFSAKGVMRATAIDRVPKLPFGNAPTGFAKASDRSAKRLLPGMDNPDPG
jgi:hypothetical protein